MQIQAFLESLKIDSRFGFMETFEKARLAEMLPELHRAINADAEKRMIGASDSYKKLLEIVRDSDLREVETGAKITLFSLDPVYFSDRLTQALEMGSVDNVRDILGYIILRSKDLKHSDERIKNTLGGIINESVLKSAQEAFVNRLGFVSDNMLRMMIKAYSVTNPGFENMSDAVKELFKTVMDKIYNTDLLYTQRYRDHPSEIYSALKTALKGYGFNMENKIFYSQALDLANMHIKQMSPVVTPPLVLPKDPYTPVKRRSSKEAAEVEAYKEIQQLLEEEKAVTRDLIKKRGGLEQKLNEVVQEIEKLNTVREAHKNINRNNKGLARSARSHHLKFVRDNMGDSLQKDSQENLGAIKEIGGRISVLEKEKKELENALHRVVLGIAKEPSGSALSMKAHSVLSHPSSVYTPIQRTGSLVGVNPLTSTEPTSMLIGPTPGSKKKHPARKK